MKVVIDTNVVLSGIFFGGVPGSLLDAWARGEFELVLTPLIFDEYERVLQRVAEKRPDLQFRATLNALLGNARLIPDPEIAGPITADPEDDKFMRAAKSAGAVVVSGDAHVIAANGWRGVRVQTPRQFLDEL